MHLLKPKFSFFFFLTIYLLCSLSIKICFAYKTESKAQKIKIDYIDKELQKIIKNISIKNDSIELSIRYILDLSTQLNYQIGIEKSYYYLSKHLEHTNKLDSSIYYYNETIKRTKGKNESNLLGSMYIDLSNLYWNISDYSQALEVILEAKNFFNETGVLNEKYQVFNLLGLCYDGLMEFEQAITNYKKAAQMALDKNREGYAGIVFANMGKVYFRYEKYDSALVYFKKGVALEEKNKLFTNAGRSYVTLANIYLYRAKMDSAKFFLDKAYAYNINTNDNIGLVRTQNTLGKYYTLLNNYIESNAVLRQAIPIAIEYKSFTELIDIYETLAINYKSLGNFQESVNYFEKYFELYQKIYNLKSITNVKSLEQKLKTTQQENEINLLKIEKQRSVAAYLSVIIGLLIIISTLSIAFVIYFRKNNKKLRHQNDRISEQKEILEELNKQLILAEQNISKVDELKTNFINTLSHEIRTPLNGIVGFSSIMVSSDMSNHEKIELSNVIKKNSDELISTIEGLVDLSLIKSNQLHIYNQTFDLYTFMDQTKDEFLNMRNSLSKENLHVQMIPDENYSNYNISCDSHILKKIISKLIQNAIKFTNKGKIEYGFTILNGQIIFFISDTGIGIPENELIFEQFTKGSNLPKNSAGLGIGLTLVKSYINLLKGKMWFETSLNKGTKFYFEISAN